MKFGVPSRPITCPRPHHLRPAGDPRVELGPQVVLRPKRPSALQCEAKRGEAPCQPFPTEQHESDVRSRRLAGEPQPSRGESGGRDRRKAIGEIEEHETEPLGAEQDFATAKGLSFAAGSNPEQTRKPNLGCFRAAWIEPVAAIDESGDLSSPSHAGEQPVGERSATRRGRAVHLTQSTA